MNERERLQFETEMRHIKKTNITIYVNLTALCDVLRSHLITWDSPVCRPPHRDVAKDVGILGLVTADIYRTSDSGFWMEWMKKKVRVALSLCGRSEFENTFTTEEPVASRHPPVECLSLSNQYRLFAIV